ncbi:hypothetical protein D9756_009123 [Leucocoprinus leucothites]|uniref:FCP1 homology domain-containing protein n=1 Tax=Leucocoprinus leucothites TaxID=201217 RepID=A0A8H5CYA7_9AGAR|nr:hypothetical protein D9756_009123 [Leucoagaricus leucothites]
MRPQRLSRSGQHTQQDQQQAEDSSRYENWRERRGDFDENRPTYSSFSSRPYDSWHNNTYMSDYADAPHRQRWRSGEYVADNNSASYNSPSGEYGYRDYDGNRRWNSTYGRSRDVYGAHTRHANYDNGYRSSRDRHYPETHNRRNEYNSARARGYRPQTRTYHSSTSTSNPIASSSNNTNDPAGQEPSTQDFSNLLFRRRESRPIRNNRTAHQTPPPALNKQMREHMERKLGPSEEYLKISAEQSEALAGATRTDVDVEGVVRKLLVLDLNGTLVYRSPHRSWHDRLPGRAGGGTAATKDDVYAQFDPSQPRPLRTAHPRPYLTSFRNYLFHPITKRWLDTMVWSSAQPHSVNDMVEKCFGDRKGELIAIWARDRLGLGANDYGRKVQTTKDLNKPWSELNSIPIEPSVDSGPSTDSSSAPSPLKREHSAKTTLLLDDSPLKAHLQPYNHLCLKEYDLEMRKHDMSVRELEVAREKYAGVLAGKQPIEDFLSKDKTSEGLDLGQIQQPDTTTLATDANNQELIQGPKAESPRKRRRKEKKENKKKEHIEQQLEKLEEQSTVKYDETLLAVIGVLDAVKRESNVAAWVRSGGLIQSLIEGGRDTAREASIASTSSGDGARSRKKLKVSKEDERGGRPLPERERSLSSVGSDEPPPRTSSPPRGTSPPGEEGRVAESETEHTGVPIDEPRTGKDGEGAESVQDRLWFNHPGTEAYWALKGREVLQELGIDVVPGVLGPTG